MKPLILLDFDGVLFNSAYEAYQVCEHMARKDARYRHNLSFDEFMNFRAHLTDAWQFNRLYSKTKILREVTKLHETTPDPDDWAFAESFFNARAEMITDPDWAKLMSPYPFFYQLRPLLVKQPSLFRILSTRNKASIQRTLDFFEADGVEIYGQEDIRTYGSKLGVAKHQRWLEEDFYVVYLDDMTSHLQPFEKEVNFCMHANWGYDRTNIESYTQGQAFQIIHGFALLANN